MQGWEQATDDGNAMVFRSSPRKRIQIFEHDDWIPAYAGMSGEMGGPTSATEPLIHAATSAGTGSTTKRYLRPRAAVAHQQSRSFSQPESPHSPAASNSALALSASGPLDTR